MAFERLREWLARSPPPAREGDIVARLLSTWKAARPLSQPHDYRAFAEDGYRRNALVYACIREIATSAAEPTVRAQRPDGDQWADLDGAHPLAALLARPRPDSALYPIIETLVTHLHVAGNAYVHKVRARSGAPVQLWLLRPDRITIKAATSGEVEAYIYRTSAETPERRIDAADVIHIAHGVDPLDDFYGLSPVAVLARHGDLDNSATDWLRAFFENAGTPHGLLKFKKKVGSAARSRVKQLWKDEHSGDHGWHSVSVLDEDADYTPVGASPEKLAMRVVYDETESRICAAFGVPPILVGAAIGLNRSTFANYAEARRSFWDETLAPLYRSLSDALTVGLAAEFGTDLKIHFDLTDVSALQEDRSQLRAFAVQGWTGQLLTRNEAREIVGLPPVPDGDEFKADASPFAGFDLSSSPQDDEEEDAEDKDADTEEDTRRPSIERAAASMRERLAREGHARLSAADVYADMLRIAARLEPRVRVAFVEAVEYLRAAINPRDLETLVATGDAEAVLQYVNVSRLGAHMQPAVERAFRDAVVAAARVNAAHLAELTGGLEMRFDITNPRAVRWAKERSAWLVKEVEDDQKELIRSIIGRGFEEQFTPRDMARMIRETGLGLHSRQERAVDRFAARLRKQGVAEDKVLARTERYARAQLRKRSMNIARTETITASCRGQLEAWHEAVDQDLLDPQTTKRRWMVTDDDRLDEFICEPMDGQEVDLYSPFITGSDEKHPAREVMTPGSDVHPQCRCGVVLIVEPV